MAINGCTNCGKLSSQCLELKEEIFTLSKRLDNLIEHFSRENYSTGCQTEPNPLIEASCQTNTPLQSAIACQTESFSNFQTSVQLQSQFTPLDDNISTPNDFLFDPYINANQEIDSHTSLNEANINIVPKMIHTISKIQSCNLLPNQPFSHFDFNQLDKDISFDKKLNNRSVCYFGDISYSYSGIEHTAQPIPKSDNYLCSILQYLSSIMPDFVYNSVLVTRYNDGSEFLRFHSDNEPEIVPNSKILTLSFGATRIFEFKPINHTEPKQTIFVRHGDAVVMSRESQNFYQHSIPADNSIHPRISITLRLLQSTNQSEAYRIPIMIHPCSTQSTEIHDVFPREPSFPEITEPTSGHQTAAPVAVDTSYTVYISDSMFKGMDSIKLSTPSQEAIVLTYPGATASGIMNNLKRDPVFSKLDKRKVRQFYLLCGANYVDGILGIPRHEQINLVHQCQVSDSLLDRAKSELNELTSFLNTCSTDATINILNILPRESIARNHVINKLNDHIKNLCEHHAFAHMICTEYYRSLFSSADGNRKNWFFSNKGHDNVHLNRRGIIRMAKHLKYLSHN